jgi:hypothetical protein
MKSRPLTFVGAFLLLIAIFLVINKEKPETQTQTNIPHVGLIETAQEAPQKQKQEKYKVSVQLKPTFPDSE